MHVVNTLEEGRAVLVASQSGSVREACSVAPSLGGSQIALRDLVGGEHSLHTPNAEQASKNTPHQNAEEAFWLPPKEGASEPASPAQPILHLGSPPFAACYAGVNYYRHLVVALSAEFPEVPFTFTLDCGDDAAIAFEALRMGFTHVRCGCNEGQFAELERVARSLEAVVVRQTRHRGASPCGRGNEA